MAAKSIAAAGEDPDRYFAERGYALRVEQRNHDDELPRRAKTRGCTHWADVVSVERGHVVASSYGAGMSDAEAKESALRRWRVEQEPSPPLPRRLP
jgi:hypothetical protein